MHFLAIYELNKFLKFESTLKTTFSVILSVEKNLRMSVGEILHFVQNDKLTIIDLFRVDSSL